MCGIGSLSNWDYFFDLDSFLVFLNAWKWQRLMLSFLINWLFLLHLCLRYLSNNFSINIYHCCFTNHLKLIKIYKKKFSLNIIKSTIVLNQKLKTGFHIYIFNSIIFPARISTNPILNEIITGACAPIVIVSFSLSPISQARARSRSLMLSARDEIIFNPPPLWWGEVQHGKVQCFRQEHR